MSTLTEIESAVEQLSREDQEKLLRHLESRLRPRAEPRLSAAAAKEWMDRLAELRDSIATGTNTAPSEQILEQLREERG
jgi:hypothetical protein